MQALVAANAFGNPLHAGAKVLPGREPGPIVRRYFSTGETRMVELAIARQAADSGVALR